MAELGDLPEINVQHEEIHFDLPDFHLNTPAPFVVVNAAHLPLPILPPAPLPNLPPAPLPILPPAHAHAPALVPEQLYEVKANEAKPLEKFPTRIFIKKQKVPAPWHQPEQDFTVTSTDINPAAMDSLDLFLNNNLPKDPTHRGGAIKFVENVLLGKSEESNKVFDTCANSKSNIPGFSIGFSF